MKKLRDPLLKLGIAYLIGLILFALFVPMFRDHTARMGTTHLGPGGAGTLLGTDEIGRDILARLAYGARVSLFIGIVVQLCNLVIGITMGVLGEFAPKPIRTVVLRLTDGMFAFPDILLAILIVGIIGLGILPVIVALTISGWPSMSRIVRTQLASLRDREFVVAARASGASTLYLVVRHMLPQMSGIILAISVIDLAGTILAESTLSFLGIGVQSPMPSWGTMVNNARANMNAHPIELVWPCAILSITIFALNYVGDGLRTLFDPKAKV